MTDEEKLNHLRMMIAAIRVTSRELINLNYQLARLHDSASFVLTIGNDSLIKNGAQLKTDYIVAETIVQNEKK